MVPREEFPRLSALNDTTGPMRDGSVTVEVILCTYDGDRFIREQLESILAQTRRVDRVSIYDDGSTDGTVRCVEAIIEEAASARSSIDIRLRRNPVNLGYAQNFAQALGMASGDYVAFSDQDDVWEPTKIEALLERMRSDHGLLAFSDGKVVDARGASAGASTVLEGLGMTRRTLVDLPARAWTLLLRGNYINGAAMMVDRVAAQSALPIPERFPHDYWLALWLSEGIVCVAEPQYRYRLHDRNVIGARDLAPHHQWLSIWRHFDAPRLQDLSRTRALLDRLALDDARRSDVLAKWQWLQAVCRDESRGRRLVSILRSWLAGSYARFGTRHALVRDLVGVLRGPVER